MIFKPIRNKMPITKTPRPKTKADKSKSINLRLTPKLQERALLYSDFTGIKITALLRNGLDELLKKNNY